ncbi:MAG: beta-galactosidase, partial [Acidobacteria bacterium]|nr:beta-galactosidase [Acidobacteriota bacterium]
MWSTGSPRDPAAWFDRLKEIGFTAEECSGCNAAPFVQNRFGFYVENLVPELGFLNNRKPIYDADFQGYTSTRDIRFLVRKPCFHDPAFWEEAKRNLQSRVRLYAGQGPLLYDLRDELSIGSFASPMDYCFGPHTLREFRKWVQEQHGTLEALNQEWETGFDSWDAVMPMTTYEVKTRERAALAAGRPENYAPWADHRAFMDLTFAQSIGRLREFIREVDPITPVGIEGAQMPSAFGGYDLWRLSQVVDWAEPYDIAGSREVWRSFLPPSAPI